MIDLSLFYQQTQAAAAAVATNYIREIAYRIDWQQRLIAIRGPRGVGKTTLLLQQIKNNHRHSTEALYLTLDDFFFTEQSLIDLARAFQAQYIKAE